MLLDPITLTFAGMAAASTLRRIETSKQDVVPMFALVAEPSTKLTSMSSSITFQRINSEAVTITARSVLGRPIHSTVQALMDWTSTGSGITPDAARDALRFFNSLPGGMPLPDVALSESGMVTLVWLRDDIYAEVEFEGNGRCYVYCRLRSDTEGDAAEDVEVTGDLAQEAVDVLMPLAPQWLGRALPQAA